MQYWQLLPQQKIEFINSLSIEAFNEFRYYSNDYLRPNQVIPEGDWRYFIAQCGRGWGKSLAGAHWLASKVYQGISGLALVAPTHGDIEDYIRDALEAEFPPHQKPRYIGGEKKKFICFNGIEIKAYSSDKEIRGSNLVYVWCDEFCAWCERDEQKATERFSVLSKAVRKGNAQIVITTTPRPWKILTKWNERFKSNDPAVKMVYGEMSENYGLSDQAKLELYNESSSTRDKRQELLGELITTVEGALFSQEIIDNNRLNCLNDIEDGFTVNDFNRIVIAVDPAVTSNEKSDSTGIIVAGKYKGHTYILEDKSGKYTPNQWANETNRLYKKYNANYICVEINMGGDLVKQNLKTVNPYMPIKEIRATKGKILRAEPIANLYEQNKIHHIGEFRELEQQMTTYTGDQSSPDRLDSMTYCVTELMLNISYTSTMGTQNVPSYR